MTGQRKAPTQDQWKKLYELMDQVKRLAPWEYMFEEDVFGFEMPGTQELGFVSVMGNLGEHFAIAVYQGADALNKFIAIEEGADQAEAEDILLIPQLQASFDDREILTPEDHKIIKSLGLKYRGRNAYPMFRGYRPNYFPWFIEKDEAQMLIHALEQLLDVAPRFEADNDIFFPTDDDDDLLLRVQKDGTWQDTVWKNPGLVEKPQPVAVEIPAAALEKLKKVMPGKLDIEFDVYMLYEPVQNKKDERPYFPYMFMLADHDSGMLLTVDLLKPLPDLETMMQDALEKLISVLSNNLSPKKIRVVNPALYTMLEPLAKHAGFRIEMSDYLPVIENARSEYERSRGLM
jgi:hypothetical protein